MANDDELFGFFAGLNFLSRLNEVALMTKLEQYVEGGSWKSKYPSKDVLFAKKMNWMSLSTYERRIKALKEIGPEIQKLMTQVIHAKMSDIKLIERALSAEQKETLSKEQCVMIGDRKVPFIEEHYSEIIDHFKKTEKIAKLSENAEERHKKDVAAVEREAKKEAKALIAENDLLKAQSAPTANEEAFAGAMTVIGNHVTVIVQICSKLDFEKAHEGIPDGPVKARYEHMIGGMEAGFMSAIQKMRDAVYGTE